MGTPIDYHRWKQEYSPFLCALAQKQVFLLFSGGKDSSLSLDLLTRAGRDFGFNVEAHAAPFPVHRYGVEEMRAIGSYWRGRGTEVVWHDTGKTDDCLEEAGNPCSVCQDLRRKMMKTTMPGLIDSWERLVIVVSYTLWDLVGYSLEHLLARRLSRNGNGPPSEKDERFIETAQRFHPILRMGEGYIVFRPLVRFNGSDVLRYIAEERIPIITVPCRFKDHRPKRLFEQYYRTAGLSFDYEAVLGFGIEVLNMPEPSFYTSMDREKYLGNVF
jgi:tRNA(Ile)-lysidine synthase TilS/MesJ